jgi:hypothetical protein
VVHRIRIWYAAAWQEQEVELWAELWAEQLQAQTLCNQGQTNIFKMLVFSSHSCFALFSASTTMKQDIIFLTILFIKL